MAQCSHTYGCGCGLQWEIYDAYMEDQQRQHLQKEMQRVKGKDKGKKDASEPGEKKEKESVMHGKSMCKAVKVGSRTVICLVRIGRVGFGTKVTENGP